ncbi:hypothetical protein OG792_01300 [Micromonospora sp. NBC_01699]|uniref:hypothetical protein n=1 Tax=Micromonospora sp. NBC_01699 TaxID=2975984 RepID=UPI002E288F36|nr:hypothetical protein [Micromonospora sp. NBC_01699]
MATGRFASGHRARAGAWVAVAVTILCAIVTLLILAAAVFTAVIFAADHELTDTTWLPIVILAMFGVISGLATAYLGRRARREFHAAR